MIEKYLFMREDLMNKCNKLTRFFATPPQHLILRHGFLEYEKVKHLPTKMAILVICRQTFYLGRVPSPHPPVGTGLAFMFFVCDGVRKRSIYPLKRLRLGHIKKCRLKERLRKCNHNSSQKISLSP